MKALIDPNASVSYIVSWSFFNNQYYPNYQTYPDSARVCQVEPDNQIFPVADPLYWEDCPDNIIADQYWFNLVTKEYAEVQNAPMPKQVAENQPVANGLQEV
jgi:hypothetical protein